jgi:hypothetical protein
MPADGTPDFLMEKVIQLLIGDLAASDDFNEATLAAIRSVAESGALASVTAVKRAITEAQSRAS